MLMSLIYDPVEHVAYSHNRYDDGRILLLSKRYDGEKTTYKALLNTENSNPINIPEDTFNEWVKYCEDGFRTEFDENTIIYNAKHWSQL